MGTSHGSVLYEQATTLSQHSPMNNLPYEPSPATFQILKRSCPPASSPCNSLNMARSLVLFSTLKRH